MSSEEDLRKKYPFVFDHLDAQAARIKLPGQILREARLKRGLTLGEAMSAIGLNHPTSPQFLHRVEKGLQRLPFDHIEPLCKVYGISNYTIRKLYADNEIRKVKAKYEI